MQQLWKYQAGISKTKNYTLSVIRKLCCGSCKGQETELWKEPPEPLLDEIAELVMKDISSWEGSATELVSLIKVEIQPHVITRKLNILSGRLYAEHGIYYKNNRTHDGRKIRFWKDDTETA